MGREAPNNDALAKMLGEHDFVVGGHRYTVLPIKLRDVRAFMEAGVFGYSAVFLLSDEDMRAKTDLWLGKQVRDARGEPLTLAKVEELDWTTDDLRRLFDRLAGISG